jgi:hypothetical protein
MPDSARRQLEIGAVPPVPPPRLGHLCGWWRELTMGRPSGGFGIARLGWRELEAWSRLTGTRPSPIEQTLLLGLDAEFCAEAQRLADMTNNRNKGGNR